jgi:hypothetical protein
VDFLYIVIEDFRVACRIEEFPQLSFLQLHSFAVNGNIIVKAVMEKEEPHDDLSA